MMRRSFTLKRGLNSFCASAPVLLLLVILFGASTGGWGQTTILDETFRTGSLPSGWTESSISFATSAGGYANFTSSSSVLTSPVFDLSGYSAVELTFDVAKFGTGGDGPITVEVSDDGGTSWTAQTFDSPTPNSSTYLTSGPTPITATGSNVRFRFIRTGSASQKRFRDFSLIDNFSPTTEPSLNSPTVASITTTSATLGATVTSDGGDAITSRGTVWGTATNPTGNVLAEGGTTVSAFTHGRSGFTANTLYYYRGYAINSIGTGYSANGTFTTLHNAPNVGSGSGATTSSIVANWTAPSGPAGSENFTYEVEVDNNSDFSSVTYSQSGISSATLSATATGLPAGTTYYYRVRANNAGGSSAWSATSTGYSTLSLCSAPSTQASAITFPAIGTVTMNVNWANGDGAGRVVIMNTADSFTTPTTGSDPSASTTYTSGQQVVYNGTGSGPISISGLTSGQTYWFRVYEYCSPDRVYQSATATGNPLSQATTGVSTSAISGSPFCVGGGDAASVSVPYTITGAFTAGNIFTAQLSNASGSFASPTSIGTLSSTVAGTITASIPAATVAGTGYRIRVVSSTPAISGSDNGSNLTIRNLTAPSAVSASCGNAEGSVSWTNPLCFDEVMVVVKDGFFSSDLPMGDGSLYTASLTYASGTAFDGGYVVYKGMGTASGTIAGLTNGVEHSFKVFSRKGTLWLASSTDECTPANICASENFTNLPTGSPDNYLSRSWIGTDVVTWTAEGSRTDQTLNGKAICFGTSGDRWVTSPTYSNGIGTLSFDYVRGFTNSNTRTLQVWINGVQFGSDITVSTSSDVPVNFSQSINLTGDVVVQIRSTTAGQVIIDDISWSCNDAPPCTAPANQPTSLNLTSVSTTEIDGSFTAAASSPYGYLAVAYPTSGSPSDAPIDEAIYTAGDPLGTGIVVGVGSATTFDATSLTPGTEYAFRVYSYNAATCSDGPTYLTTSPLTATAFTLPENVTDLTTGCADGTSMEISWAAPVGGSGGVVIAMRASPTLSVHTISGNNSSFTPNSIFSSGFEFGGTTPYSYVVYRGTGTSVTVTGLTPGTTYQVKASTYVSTNLWSTGTTTSQIAQVPEVTGAFASPGNTEVSLTWSTPEVGCFDEVLVIARSTSAVTATPTGDGSSYSANPSFGAGTAVLAGQFVVYKGAGTSELITDLTNFTLYHFEVFVRKGTEWSAGVPLSATPNTATALETGDLIIVAVNTQVLSSGGTDEVCFVAFKDIVENTSIDFTDNGFERLYAGEWGDTEGTIRLTRKSGASTVPLGQVICVQGAGNSSSNFDIQIDGVNDNANWTIVSLNTSFNFDLNKRDQIWIMQNGGWINPSGSQNAEYTGNVLYGWTAVGWRPTAGYDSTGGSTIPEGLSCFTTDVQSLNNVDKVKYTGPTSAATQRSWIARVNDPGNWTGYASNAAYNAGFPDYWGASLPSISILPGGFDEGIWEGTSNTNWFDCDNWQNLDVPDETVNVTVSSSATTNIEVNSSAAFAAQYGFIAKANNIDISRNQLSLADTGTAFEVYGDLTISGTGALAFDATIATELTLFGDWNNQRSETAVTEGFGLVRFAGGEAQTLSVQTGTVEILHNIVLDKDAQTVLTLNDDLQTTATGALSLVSGIIETGSNKVSIQNTSSGAVSGFEGFSLALPGIYQNNGFIYGTMERQISGAGVYDFPVGEGVGITENGYNRVVLDVASGNGLVNATYFPGSPGTIDVATTTTCGVDEFDVVYTGMNDGYWRLIQTSGPTIAYDITAYPNILAGITIPSVDGQYRLLKAPTGTSDWSSYALTGDPCQVSPSFYEVVGAGYSGFSDFSIGGGATPLPVELVEFTAANSGAQVLVQWVTESEFNSDFYTIERSADGWNFSSLLKVQGAGTTTERRTYARYDEQPLTVISYYRLRQTDFDGSETLSKVVAVERQPGISAGVVWPNPASDMAYWSDLALQQGSYRLEITDVLGRVALRQEMNLLDGPQTIILDLSGLAQGSYWVRLQGGGKLYSAAIIRN
jgi:hypothetical protein